VHLGACKPLNSLLVARLSNDKCVRVAFIQTVAPSHCDLGDVRRIYDYVDADGPWPTWPPAERPATGHLGTT
jgi:hypothetical protein